MPERHTYDYAVIRVVPRVEREEFVNAGVIVSCPARDYLGCGMAADDDTIRALDRSVDLEAVHRHLQTFERICVGGEEAGPIGRLSRRERFHWLVSPRSTMIQVSPVHTGQCEDPERLLDHLLQTMVRRPAGGGNDRD